MLWVALIGPEVEENLGLRYIAASLNRAGFPTGIVSFNHELELRQVRDLIVDAPEPPFMVAIAMAVQWRAQDCVALAVALRQKGYRGHITAGGHFGHFVRRELLEDFPELDSICRHEAEKTVTELACALRDGRPLDGVRGLAIRDSENRVMDTPSRPPPELTSLPWPDRRGEPASCLGHVISPIIGSRGCYANCAFCCIAAWHRAGGGKRFRLRAVEDVADEMAFLHRHHGTEIFIFHDDNFFLADPNKSLERVNTLADALDARQVRPIATVVKARPNDVTEELFQVMVERLGLLRAFLGVENASPQGLVTLRRRVNRQQIDNAAKILSDLGVYICFNLLVFDPDTTLESLETNIGFMERHSSTPHNLGRVELYVGTPLLARMQRENRCRGDYFGWDYDLADPKIQRVFNIALKCFYERIFSENALINRMMGTRFDVETCRLFHPDVYRPEWLERARELSRRITTDTVAGLRQIIEWVEQDHDTRRMRRLGQDLSARLRKIEQVTREDTAALEEEIQAAVGVRCNHERPGTPTLTILESDHAATTRKLAAP